MNTSKKKTFNELIRDGEQPVLVDFHATWCGPCHSLAPVVQEVASDFKDRLKVIKIDIDKNQAAAQQYQVRSVPTLILFWKGNILWRQSGLMTKRDLSAQLNQFLQNGQAVSS